MASRHPSHAYRGAEPDVDLPAPQIPISRTPWFVVLLAVFAVITLIGMLIGFWRAANPPKIEPRPAPAELAPRAPAP